MFHWLTAPTAGRWLRSRPDVPQFVVQGATATVTQSEGHGFFLSNTTTGGTASDGTSTTIATAAWDAVMPQSKHHSDLVSNVAELTVVLSPTDEKVPAPMLVCSTVDSAITESSVDDVVVLPCCGNLFFLNFYVGDAGNTPLMGLALSWARPQSLPQRVLIVYIGGAASWRPCNVAYPHQGLVSHS